MNTLTHLMYLLKEVERTATMETMGMGFPDDRIEVKSVHFGDDRTGRVGDLIHPTDYVRNITKIWRDTWLLAPLREAIAIVEANQELIDRCAELEATLKRAGLQEVVALNKSGRG